MAMRAELVRRLLEREVNSRLAVARALEEELQAEERLARPGPALDHRRARARQPAAEHFVEPGGAGRGRARRAIAGLGDVGCSGPRTRGKNASPSAPISKK